MFLSERQLMDRWGVSRTTLWRLRRKRPGFPRRVQLSPGRKAYAEDEVAAYEEQLRTERELQA